MYSLFRKLFFTLEPEQAHYAAMNFLKAACALPGGFALAKKMFAPRAGLEKEVFGLRFRNPVGLGAGFDKNAAYLRELDALGFGFVEIGTVTPKPQSGNDKPRLFRLPKDKALINRMGFNNDGVEVVAERLRKYRTDEQGTRNVEVTGKSNYQLPTTNRQLIIGGNIGKNKATPNEEAWKDYEICFRALHLYVDFFVVNVSSPNTPGLRELQEKDSLRKILTHLQAMNKTFAQQKPILLKIAPDLTPEQVDDVIQLAAEIKLDGLVATNTTISRDALQTSQAEVSAIGAGGLSGKPVQQISTGVLRHICEKTDGQLPVIGSGGIFTGADAAEKMAAGAILCEVWTGFIYEGPFIVKKICRHLK